MTLHLRPDEVPPQVTQAMADRTPVTYGEVTLRAPTQPGGAGASGQHRLEWTDPDTGKRRQAGATKLADAWRRTAETAEMLQRRKQRTAHRSLTGVTLDQLVEAYLQPGVHARWGENRRMAVTWALTNWVVGDDLRIPLDGAMVRARDLLVDELTPSRCEQLLEHAREGLAPRSYRDVYSELCTLLRWASREGLRPKDDLPDQVQLARPKKPDPFATPGQTVVPVDPDDIPPLEAIDELRAVALDDEPVWGGLAVDCLAFGGFRIGELLAMSNDERSLPFDEQEGVFRPFVWRRVHRGRNETRTPKHDRTRHAWLPPWLTDEVRRVAEASTNGKLFPAPRGGWFPPDRFRTRRFNLWQERAGWPKLPDDDPRPFVWKWPPHSLRHHAATWMLNDLGLAPDDVAEFLGHADGHQIWVMYSRIRPGLASRATHLALEAGDPRGNDDRGDG